MEIPRYFTDYVRSQRTGAESLQTLKALALEKKHPQAMRILSDAMQLEIRVLERVARTLEAMRTRRAFMVALFACECTDFELEVTAQNEPAQCAVSGMTCTDAVRLTFRFPENRVAKSVAIKRGANFDFAMRFYAYSHFNLRVMDNDSVQTLWREFSEAERLLDSVFHLSRSS